MGLHATNLSISKGAGLDLHEGVLHLDTGRYAFDLPWSELVFAYTVSGESSAVPILCLMPEDSRPICLGNMSFDSPWEVAAALNLRARGFADQP